MIEEAMANKWTIEHSELDAPSMAVTLIFQAINKHIGFVS